jgi:hypothetical protein
MKAMQRSEAEIRRGIAEAEHPLAFGTRPTRMNAAINQPARHDAEALRIEPAKIDDIDGHGANVTRRRAAGSADYCIAVEALTPYFMLIGGRSASPL